MQQQISRRGNKTRANRRDRQIDKITQPSIETSKDGRSGKGIARQQNITGTTGFNLNSLKFEPISKHDATIKAGGNLYGKDLIQLFINVICALKYVDGYEDLHLKKAEWNIQTADLEIHKAHSSLKEKYPYSELICSFDNDDVFDSLRHFIPKYNEEDDKVYIGFIENHSTNTGALFLEEFIKANPLELEYLLKGLKLLHEMHIYFWDQIPDWDNFSGSITDLEDFIKENDLVGKEGTAKYKAALEDYGMRCYSPKVLKAYKEWETSRHIWKDMVVNIESDYECLYDRILQKDDALSTWLKAILYLHSIDFDLHDYSYADDSANECVNHYCIFLNTHDGVTEAFDSENSNRYEISWGISNMKIVSQDGIICDNLNKPIAEVLELIFSYRPKLNSFYGRTFSTERIETITSHIDLSVKQKRQLCRVSENYRKRYPRSF